MSWACLLNQSLATVKVRAVVFVGRAVELVGSGLGDHADLRAGGAASIGIGIAGGDAKLFDGVLGLAQDAGECVAVDLIVVVDAVEGDVALIRTAAVDSTAAAVVPWWGR